MPRVIIDGVRENHRIVLEVTKNPDETYDIVFNGERVGQAIERRWLNDELCGKHGFCGEELNEIVRQLDETGEAQLVL